MSNRTFPLTIKIAANVTRALRNLSKLEKSVGSISKAADKMGKSLSLKVTVPILGIGAASLRSAANIETIAVAFESLTGSADKAQETVKNLISFTAKTPFQLDQVAGASRQLLAAGISTDDLNSKLLILGDIAAGANVPLNDMAAIFVKIKNKQKAQAEEINQLSERGIPIIQALSKELGVAENEIFGLASKGKISFDLIERSLSNMRAEGGIFANQMERQSRTLSGIFSTLKDNINLAGAELGAAIVQTTGMKEAMNKLISAIQSITQWFKSLHPETQNLVVILGIIVAAMGPVLFLFGQLGFAIIGISAAITTAAPVLLFLARAFRLASPLFLVWGISKLIKEFSKLINMAESVGQALDAAFTGTIVVILEKLQFLAKGINAVFDLIGKRSAALDNFTSLDLTEAGTQAISKNIDLSTKGGRSTVDVNFSNAPQGTRVSSQTEGNLDLGTNLGLQLARP